MTDLSEPLPATKRELLDRIERARAALARVVGGLSHGQIVAPGPDGGWSVKDHLAHLAAWEAGMAALLQRRPRYPAMGVGDAYLTAGEDAINDMIHERSKGRPPAEVLADLRKAQQELLASLAGLTDADLLKTYSHYQPDEPGEDSGEPILKWIASNTYEHYVEHGEWIEALVG